MNRTSVRMKKSTRVWIPPHLTKKPAKIPESLIEPAFTRVLILFLSAVHLTSAEGTAPVTCKRVLYKTVFTPLCIPGRAWSDRQTVRRLPQRGSRLRGRS